MSGAAGASLDDALELMGRVLRGPDKSLGDAPGLSAAQMLAAEYPLVFADNFGGKVVALGEASGTRSACTVLERDLRLGDESLRVGMIGSVSTDPAHRHQGLATRVLQEAEAVLRAQDCLFALLWADDPRFYFARGYQPIGWEVDYSIDATVARAIAPVDARVARAQDGAAIHALYQAHEYRTERSDRETEALLACPGMSSLVCERNGAVTAYACVGRGQDLAGTLHEWGGQPSDVLGLIREHWIARDDLDAPLFVMTPPSAVELHRQLDALGAPRTEGILGLGKLLDRAGASTLLERLSNGTARVSLDELHGPQGSAAINDAQLLELLIAPRGLRTAHGKLERELGLDLSRLPLTPFAWGLDSI